jgi:putative lipoprotein
MRAGVSKIAEVEIMNRLPILIACLLLVACGRDQAAPEAEITELRGELHYLERIMMPPGSWLEIELIDEDSEQVLSLARLDDTRSPPFAYELAVDTAAWQQAVEPMMYFTLYAPDGSPRFAAEHRPAPGEDRMPPVRLLAVDLSEEAPEVFDEPIDSSDWTGWRCGEIPVDVLFEAEERIQVVLPWRDLSLGPVVAASGARYGEEQHEFWSRGDSEAILILPGQSAIECERADQLSPWTRARQRGVGFRATGNEPGWLMEVTGGEPTELRLMLDHGSHELVFDEVEVLPEQAGYVAEAPGNHAEIRLLQADCQDTMSGWVFPVRVEMNLNDLTLSACGRQL